MKIIPHESDDNKPHEYCGVFGVFGVPRASSVIFNGLFALQHRGQEGAGMVLSDGEHVRSHKGVGLLNDVFEPKGLEGLKGHLGIGHVRYSTTGSSRPQNVQPLVAECLDGLWSIAHNGNLINAHSLRKSYQEAGAIFQTGTDSEVLVHLIADPMYRSRPRRVERALAELKGAFTFLLMTKDCVMAARDPYGFRPLTIGKLGDGYIFSSESCAIQQVGGEVIRDVLPGELVIADAKGVRSSTFCEPVSGHLGQCIFEHIYFARPDSVLFGQTVHKVRVDLGHKLALTAPVEADMVIPVPDSGNDAALGYSQESGIPLEQGFIRNHYIGRTFIMPSQVQRDASVDMKLSLIPGAVKGKRVVVVDDSIVRGTTCRRRVTSLREAGAKEIHMRISCPPIEHPCFFGIDFPSKAELAAAKNTIEEIREFITADSLAYLSVEDLLSTVDHPQDFCTGCFTGKYPLTPPDHHLKDSLESSCD